MKLRHLGAPLAVPAAPPPPPPPSAPPEASCGPVLYAGVMGRDASGAPSAIALPGLPASPRVPLYTQRADGSPMWLGDVLPDGELRTDGLRARELAAIRPGVRIVAASDTSGRIIALSAAIQLPAPGGAKRRAAPARPADHVPPAGPINARSADPYAPDPSEVLIAGTGGGVLRVE
jgi:hypothetical protein